MRVSAEQFGKQVEFMRSKYDTTRIIAADGVRLDLFTVPKLACDEVAALKRLTSGQIKALVGDKLTIELRGE